MEAEEGFGAPGEGVGLGVATADAEDTGGGILPVLEESDEIFRAGLLKREVIPSRPPWAWTLERALSRSAALTSTLERRFDRELES